jgi:small subunit ribosomal protein S20
VPSTKSRRVAERKRRLNTPLRSKARSYVRKARRIIESDDAGDAEQSVQQAIVALDKAAQRGAIHRRNAARRKSRLMAQLNSASSE